MANAGAEHLQLGFSHLVRGAAIIYSPPASCPAFVVPPVVVEVVCQLDGLDVGVGEVHGLGQLQDRDVVGKTGVEVPLVVLVPFPTRNFRLLWAAQVFICVVQDSTQNCILVRGSIDEAVGCGEEPI